MSKYVDFWLDGFVKTANFFGIKDVNDVQSLLDLHKIFELSKAAEDSFLVKQAWSNALKWAIPALAGIGGVLTYNAVDSYKNWKNVDPLKSNFWSRYWANRGMESEIKRLRAMRKQQQRLQELNALRKSFGYDEIVPSYLPQKQQAFGANTNTYNAPMSFAGNTPATMPPNTLPGAFNASSVLNQQNTNNTALSPDLGAVVNRQREYYHALNSLVPTIRETGRHFRQQGIPFDEAAALNDVRQRLNSAISGVPTNATPPVYRAPRSLTTI